MVERHVVALQGDLKDRQIAGVDLAHHGRAGQVRGQLALRGADRLKHVGCGGIDAAIQVELQRDRLPPRKFTDVICVSPAIWLNCVSRGWATALAITSGLAPG